VRTLFLACAAVGGGILLLQLVLGLFGIHGGGHDLEHGHDHDVADGLSLRSVRALSAGVAFFGVTGSAALAGGAPAWLATLAAAVVGSAAMVAVAAIVRGMARFESDGVVRIEGAIGSPGTVYLRIPAGRAGAGKVMLALQDRLVELRAVTSGDELPTGASVVVVDVVSPDTVEVAIPSNTGDYFNARA
jgi:hypothetical protein